MFYILQNVKVVLSVDIDKGLIDLSENGEQVKRFGKPDLSYGGPDRKFQSFLDRHIKRDINRYVFVLNVLCVKKY